MNHRWISIPALALSLAASPGWSAPSQGTGAPSVVIATQGGQSVTLADIDAFAERIPAGDRASFFRSPERVRSAVANVLMQKQLAQEARTAGLDKEPDVARQVELATTEVLARAESARFRATIKMPDFSQLARENYIAHKDRYAIPATLDVRHILISTKDRSEADAAALARTVEAEARKDPQQFEALVQTYSDDPSKASNDGLMHQAGSKRYAPEFAAAAKALAKPGDISSPVKTRFGFHILQLVAEAPAQSRPFDEVKTEIEAELAAEYVKKKVAENTGSLSNAPMDINEVLMDSLRTRYVNHGTAAPTADAKP